MKSFAAFAIATTLAFGLALPAVAQEAASNGAHQWQNGPRHFGPGRSAMPGRGMGPNGLLMLACSDKGAEALEIGLVRMSYRLQLTADQQKLFDALRTKALATQTSFAGTCKASRPANGAGSDALARIKAGIAIEQARLTALNDVLPDFEAFFNSLSDQQKADLLPQRGPRMGGGHWDWNGGAGRGADRDAPAAPGAAPQNS